jgi:hypothetical protein
MKKITLLLLAAIMIILLVPSQANSKPFFIKVKIGFFAKWSVTTNGDCDNGWGICLALNPDPNPEPTYIGYDPDVDKFYLRVAENYSQAKNFSNDYYELKEDSPVDPKLTANMTNFSLKGKYVVIKKGNYKVLRDGGYYIIGFDYYQK